MGRPLRVIQTAYPYHLVLMSNHYHIVATATEKNLHRAMSRQRRDPVQPVRGPDRASVGRPVSRHRRDIIDTDEYYLACVRYIYRNPLRANMVKDLEHFPDSGPG